MKRGLAAFFIGLLLITFVWTRPAAEAQVWTYGSVAREMWDTLGQTERLRLAAIVFGSGATTATVATSLAACVSTVWCGAMLLTAGLLAGALARYYVESNQPAGSGQTVTWFDNGTAYFRWTGQTDSITIGADAAAGTFHGCSLGAPVPAAGVLGKRNLSVMNSAWKWPDNFIGGTGQSFRPNQMGALYACARPGPSYNTYPGNPTEAEALTDMKTKQAQSPSAVEDKLGDMIATLPDDRTGVEGKGVKLVPPFGDEQPAPGPGPTTCDPDCPPTQASDKGLFQWLIDSFQAWFSYLYSQVQTLTKAVTDLPTLIWGAFEAGLKTLFQPTQASYDAWQAVRTTLAAKPPFSLLPPDTLFADPGGSSSCSLAAISVDMTPTLGATASLEWPDFVCTAVGWLRTFFKGLLYIVLGWWVIDRVYPRVHI